MSVKTTASSSYNNARHNRSLLNAPKCPFKVPTALPPTLHLNEPNADAFNARCRCNDAKNMSIVHFALDSKDERNDDSSLSTSSESEDEEQEQTPISILRMLEKLV